MSKPMDTTFEQQNFFGRGPENSGFARYFSGTSYLNPLTKPGESAVFLANVTFEPGCRNNWHIHHASKGGGQILICIAGKGWYQEEGQPARALQPGDVVVIPANVKHWHGAQKDSWFSHIAVEVPGEDTAAEWCEPVDDAAYQALLAAEMEGNAMSKTLIAFYSRAGENYFGGAMRHIEVGNTEVVAKMLQEITEGDLFEIEQVKPYSDSYMTCIEEAKQDLEANARPAVKTFPESLNGYDTIYLCYPNYWGTMPMAVWTFLEHFDWNGKTIYPLCTNEGSGMGRSEADIQKLCPAAVLGKGLAVTGSQVQKARPSLEHWVKQNK